MPLTTRPLPLPGLLLIAPQRFTDNRGTFEVAWNQRDYEGAGISMNFVQDNHSISTHAGTIRGLHFQSPPYAQAKLVRCTRGAIYDVAVDIRRGSASYGEWIGLELDAKSGEQLFIPEGFLHGFITLEPLSEVQYKCSANYSPELDGAVRWDSVGINWPLTSKVILSSKDAAAQRFVEFKSPFTIRAES